MSLRQRFESHGINTTHHVRRGGVCLFTQEGWYVQVTVYLITVFCGLPGYCKTRADIASILKTNFLLLPFCLSLSGGFPLVLFFFLKNSF